MTIKSLCAALLLTACSALPVASTPTPAMAQTTIPPIDPCTQFGSSFDELAACERANGTLNTFSDPNIQWRVRYFIRYLEMPCGEMPTVQEAYVFQMAWQDLNNDGDITQAQNQAIRTAMYSGVPQCP